MILTRCYAPALVVALLLAGVCFSGCQSDNNTKLPIPEKDHITGLANLVVLSMGESTINLNDFFLDCSIIDSADVSAPLVAQLAADKQSLTISAVPETGGFLFELRLWINGFPQSILLRRPRTFQFQATFDPKGKTYQTVELAGEFNGWTPGKTPFKVVDGKWRADLVLNPGTYQYQYVLDGIWTLDPDNPDSISNNLGSYNSCLKIGLMDKSALPFLYTDHVSPGRVAVGIENTVTDYFVLWNNFRLGSNYVVQQGNKLKIDVPEAAANQKRSYLRVFAANTSGVSNDLFIPLENGKVLEQTAQLKRDDKHSNLLYFAMVDRFNNGNRANDHPIIDREVADRANYQGGDLAGVLQKLKDGYFESLNINTIWLSPITQNPRIAYTEYPEPHRKYSGYHGYWPISLTTIDERFGQPADLKAIVAEAHSRNINVILDFVSNHIHEEHPLFKAHPDWFTQLDLPDGRKNIRIWDEHRLTTWFDTFLPTFDQSNPAVREAISDSALFWVQEYDLDGYRHDATKHIPEEYWRLLTHKIKEKVTAPAGKQVYQVGETFGSRDLIGSYVGSGQMDGQFDFNLYFDARTIFADDDAGFHRLEASLQESLDHYGAHHLMANITGNHDLPRFISYAGGGLSWSEDAQQVGWERPIQVVDTVGYAKLSSLTAFIMTIPGVPVIYYGDEMGMPGAGDPDNRRPMRFEQLNPYEAATRTRAARITQLRREFLSLVYGDWIPIQVSEKQLVYGRTYFDEITVVVFNKGRQAETLEFDLPARFADAELFPNFGSTVDKQGKHVSVVLPHNAFDILTIRENLQP